MAEPISTDDFAGAGCAHVRLADALAAMQAELLEDTSRLGALKSAVETRIGRTLTVRQFVRLMAGTLAEWMRDN